MAAITKLSLAPARRLEPRVPAFASKGRIRVGADADLVLFHADTVAAGATYDRPQEPSRGIEWVLVAGTPVVARGALVADAFPGRPLRAAVTAR
jgi:N-acyl-D-aspartate/D-glutamate deacylase